MSKFKRPFQRAKVRDPGDYQDILNRDVYPALFKTLDSAFPDFGWKFDGTKWEADTWPPTFPLKVTHERPDRLQVYPDRPWWIKVHGRDGVRFIDMVNGGTKPTGPAFDAACRELARRAGIPSAFPERQRTAEQILEEEQRETRRAFIEAMCALTEVLL